MKYRVLALLPILSLFLAASSQAQQGVGSGGLGKIPIATITAPGAVQPDGSTITITSKGVITSTGGSGGTPANPTASIGAAAVNGSATTYMRSDAAPKIGTNAVTNALIAQMPQHTFKGNNTGSTATPLDLTIAQLNTELVGNAFFNVTGPSASIKTFTFPNASATVLTTNAAVTVGQGGTGIASGTSGGVLAYTASGTLASSSALTANLPVIGGGAGVAPSVGTRSGNTTTFVTTTGSQTSGDCVKIDASGNHVANGSACGSGGSVSVTAGTANIVVTPSPGTVTFTIGTTEAGRDASGSGVAIVTADNTKTVQLGAFTYTLAQAGTTGFASGWGSCLLNVGATAATVTSTTSVFKGAGGATSLTIPSGSFACPVSDGTDYVTTSGSGAASTGTGNVVRATSATLVTPALGTPSALVLTNATGLPVAQVPAVLTPTPATTHTLTAPREYYACTGTCTVTVPVPAAGYEFCVFNDDNVATAITLGALGSSAMYENSARTAYGTAGTGTLVLSAAAANKVCLVGRDSTHYWTLSYNGAVTVN